MPRKSRIRIRGNDRLIMMLCRDARRRWLQYGENRKSRPTKCVLCKKRLATDCDHIVALGPRPRTTKDFRPWLESMIYSQTQWLCKTCHKEKTTLDRAAREDAFDGTMWLCNKCEKLTLKINVCRIDKKTKAICNSCFKGEN